MGRTTRPISAMPARKEFLNEQGLIYGTTYASAAVIADGTPPVPAEEVITTYVPSARPGGRAPHVWLQRGDDRVSTLDLFGPHFTLMTGPSGGDWRDAARRIAQSPALPVRVYTIGVSGDLADHDGEWRTIYGLEADGAVLVRPDGYVAWRNRSGCSAAFEVLTKVFDAILCRNA